MSTKPEHKWSRVTRLSVGRVGGEIRVECQTNNEEWYRVDKSLYRKCTRALWTDKLLVANLGVRLPGKEEQHPCGGQD